MANPSSPSNPDFVIDSQPVSSVQVRSPSFNVEDDKTEDTERCCPRIRNVGTIPRQHDSTGSSPYLAYHASDPQWRLSNYGSPCLFGYCPTNRNHYPTIQEGGSDCAGPMFTLFGYGHSAEGTTSMYGYPCFRPRAAMQAYGDGCSVVKPHPLGPFYRNQEWPPWIHANDLTLFAGATESGGNVYNSPSTPGLTSFEGDIPDEKVSLNSASLYSSPGFNRPKNGFTRPNNCEPFLTTDHKPHAPETEVNYPSTCVPYGGVQAHGDDVSCHRLSSLYSDIGHVAEPPNEPRALTEEACLTCCFDSEIPPVEDTISYGLCSRWVDSRTPWWHDADTSRRDCSHVPSSCHGNIWGNSRCIRSRVPTGERCACHRCWSTHCLTCLDSPTIAGVPEPHAHTAGTYFESFSANEASPCYYLPSYLYEDINDGKEMPLVNTTPILNLPEDVVKLIIGFLNPVEDLSRLGACCKSFQFLCSEEWERRDLKISSIGRSSGPTARERTIRFFQAEQHAESIKNDGCFDVCTVIDNYDQYEFFARFLQSESLIWQGFLPASSRLRSYHVVLDMEQVYPVMNWNSMECLFEIYENLGYDSRHSRSLAESIFGALDVVVVAVHESGHSTPCFVAHASGCIDSGVLQYDGTIRYQLRSNGERYSSSCSLFTNSIALQRQSARIQSLSLLRRPRWGVIRWEVIQDDWNRPLRETAQVLERWWSPTGVLWRQMDVVILGRQSEDSNAGVTPRECRRRRSQRQLQRRQQEQEHQNRRHYKRHSERHMRRLRRQSNRSRGRW